MLKHSWLYLLLSFSLVAAGCGDDDADDDDDDATDAGDDDDDSGDDDDDADDDDDSGDDDDDAADAGDECLTPEDTGDPATFGDIYTGIIRARCTCHTPATGFSGGLNMSTQALAYENLVGTSSDETGDCAGKIRVIAGNAENSLIYQKIRGKDENCDHVCERRMPRSGNEETGEGFLNEEEIGMFRTWINAGAMDN